MKYIFLIFVILKFLSCFLTEHFGVKYRKNAVLFNPISTLLCICIIWTSDNRSIEEALPITICLIAYEIMLQIIMFVINMHKKNEKQTTWQIIYIYNTVCLNFYIDRKSEQKLRKECKNMKKISKITKTLVLLLAVSLITTSVSPVYAGWRS